MDYDNSSFEDTSLSSGKKFIALVVSDHSDLDDSGILESSIDPSFSNSTANSSVLHEPILPINNTISTTCSKKKTAVLVEPSPVVLRRPQKKNKSRDVTKRYSMMIPDNKTDSIVFDHKSPLLRGNHHSNTPSNNNNSNNISNHNTVKNEEKKRWSFISNHSSSSKKRWSALSSFTIESVSSSNISTANNSNNNTPESRHSTHSSNKRFSTTSNISIATTTTSTNNTDVISFQNKNTSIDNISNHTGKSNSSLKRSSTGSSLRQFLTNIVTPSDHTNKPTTTSTNSNNTNSTLDPQYNKENQYSSHNYKNGKSKSKTSTIPPIVQVDSRRPLQRIAVNDQYLNVGNNNTQQEHPRDSLQYDNISLYSNRGANLSNGHLNASMENLSLRSKRSSISSMSSSSSLSKWKFWKKNSNSYANSSSHHHHQSQKQQHKSEYVHTLKNSASSQTINISSYSSNGDNQTTHHLPQSHSTRTVHNQLSERPLSTYSHETNKLRSKNSLSDFHKSFYNTGNGSIATSIHNIAEMKSDFSFYSNVDYNNSTHNVSLKKKSSTSSLVMSGLKHRTSQHSLKHKTSHSSLNKFKTRRKSNNDDGSSFLTTSSSVNSGHGSSGGTSSNPKISLPIPNQVSRDKIRTKLKNSTSLLSLNSHIPVDKKTYDETMLNQLLQLCTVEYAIDFIDLDSEPHKHLETLSSNHSIQLSNHVWRSASTLDPNQTIICKKFILANDDDEVILKELQMLSLCKMTPGLPQLLQSYIVTKNTNENTLYVFLRDHGNPITETILTSWSQCLKIFWQCVNILYVAETKFQFEHRNLTLNHILIDKNGTVTLCDLSMSRATYGKDAVLFTRLDHPVFFQGGHDYLFDTYHSMRSVFVQHGEQWNNFEPRTNLLWLRYVAMNLLIKNKNNKLMGPGREQLTKIVTLLDHHGSLSGNKRGSHLFGKRKEYDIKSAGDLLRYK